MTGGRRRAVLPVTGYSLDQSGRPTFTSEVAVLKVSGTSLARQATIRHPQSSAGGGPIPSPIRRSLVIGGQLVTVSIGGVKINDLTTITPRAWIPTA